MLHRRNFIRLGILLPLCREMWAVTGGEFECLHRYENETGGRIGLFAHDLTTGKTLSWRANERFIMCSTFKFSLAAFALAQVDGGKAHLEEAICFGSADLEEYAPIAKKNLDRGQMSLAEMC